MIKPSIILSYLIFASLPLLYGQDLDFSNYKTSSLIINPANTGNFDGSLRFSGNYKVKKSSYLNNFNTIFFSADGGILKKTLSDNGSLGIGLNVISDKNTEGILNRNYVSFTSGYQLNLDRNFYHKLGIGFGITLAEVRLNPKRLIFEEPGEVIYRYGFVNLVDPSVLFNAQPIHYLDYSIGLLYSMKGPEDKKIQRLNIGLSLYHVNSPKYESPSITFIIYPKITTHFDGAIRLPENAELSFNFLYNIQKSVSPLFLATTSYSKMLSKGENNYTIHLGGGYKNDYLKNKFLTGILGFSVNKIEFTLSYDFNITNNQPLSTNRSSELGIIYLFNKS